MQLTLTTRIAAAATILLTVFVAAIGVYSFRAMRDMVSSHMDEMLSHVGVMTTHELNGTLEEIESSLHALAANSLIGNALVDDLGRNIYLPNFLSGFKKVAGIPVAVFVTNFEGQPFAANRQDAHLVPTPGTIAAGIDENRRQALVIDGDGTPTMVLVEPVIFANTGLPEGAVVYQFTLISLMTAPEIRGMLSTFPAIREPGLSFTDSQTGRSRVIPSSPSLGTAERHTVSFPAGSLAERLGLGLVIVPDRTELDRRLTDLTVTFSALGAATLVLVLIASRLAARRLTGGLRELEGTASAIVAEGRASKRFQVSGNDEVSRLGSAFNAVLERLERAYAELEGRAREQLGRQERKYRRVVEQAGEALFVFDHDGRILEANLFACDMLGYANEALLDLTVSDLAPSLTREKFTEKLASSPPGESQSLETEFRHRSGRVFPVEIRSGVIDQEQERQVLWMVRDISEWVEAMRKLKNSNAELQEFAYVASHDLREPLRMVTSYLQLLDRKYRGELGQDAHEFIDYAVGGAKRMDALIKDLLQYSRVETMGEDFAPADADEILEEALDNLQSALSESGGSVTADPLPCVLCDRHQIIRLFQNLIENALKYRAPDRPPVIHVSVEKDGGAAIFSIRDNGIGIAPEYRDRVFVIFQRLHGREEYSGTGIGLAVCRKIVERHRGRIWVEAAPEQGSIFRFTLPTGT